jgi:hypothetical protein
MWRISKMTDEQDEYELTPLGFKDPNRKCKGCRESELNRLQEKYTELRKEFSDLCDAIDEYAKDSYGNEIPDTRQWRDILKD